jgi:hypothetical protein
MTVIDAQEIKVAATCHIAWTRQLAHGWEFTSSWKELFAAICDL